MNQFKIKTVEELEHLRHTDELTFYQVIHEKVPDADHGWLRPIALGQPLDVFKYLYQFIPTVYRYSQRHHTPLLHLIVSLPNTLEHIKFLIEEAGVDVNLQDGYGRTCLFYTDPTYVDYLIQRGANMYLQDGFNDLAVIYRARQQYDYDAFLPYVSKELINWALKGKHYEVIRHLLTRASNKFTRSQLYVAYRMMNILKMFQPEGKEWYQKLEFEFFESTTHRPFDYYDHYFITEYGPVSPSRLNFLETCCVYSLFGNDDDESSKVLAFIQLMEVMAQYPAAYPPEKWNCLVLTDCIKRFCRSIPNSIDLVEKLLLTGYDIEKDEPYLILIAHWFYAIWKNGQEEEDLVQLMKNVPQTVFYFSFNDYDWIAFCAKHVHQDKKYFLRARNTDWFKKINAQCKQ